MATTPASATEAAIKATKDLAAREDNREDADRELQEVQATVEQLQEQFEEILDEKNKVEINTANPVLKDKLLDILRHTHGLGFIKAVRVATEENNATKKVGTYVHAYEIDRKVLVSATFHETWEELPEGVIGLNELPILSAALKSPGQQLEGSSVAVKRETSEDGKDSRLTELEFQNPEGTPWVHRMMPPTTVDNTIKPLYMKDLDYNVTFKPSKERLNEFRYTVGGLKEFAKEFTFKFDADEENDGKDQKVIADFGGLKGLHRAQVVMASGKDVAKIGEINPVAKWSSAHVLKVLKIAESAKDWSINLIENEKGKIMMVVSMDSGLATWEFVLPAQKSPSSR